MTKNKTINKIIKTVERKFSYYPETSEVKDLKEELISIMLDKYHDLTEGTEKQKYKECVSIMMQSYKQVLHDLEIKTSRSVLKDKIMKFTFFSLTYFVLFVAMFLITGEFIIHDYSKASLIIIVPSILYLTLTTYYFWMYCRKMKFEILQRVCMGLFFLTLIGVIYVVPNLCITFYANQNFWHPSWLLILLIGYIYLVADRLCYPLSRPLFRLLNNCGNILALSTIIFISVSVMIGHWHITWLIYVLCLIACEINIYLYFKNRI